jgi:hypothetical protein
MRKPTRSWLIRYLLPFGAVLVILLVQAVITFLAPRAAAFPYWILYLIAVLAVAWQGGYTA